MEDTINDLDVEEILKILMVEAIMPSEMILMYAGHAHYSHSNRRKALMIVDSLDTNLMEEFKLKRLIAIKEQELMLERIELSVDSICHLRRFLHIKGADSRHCKR